MEWFWTQLMRVDARLAAGAIMIISAVAAGAAVLQVGLTPVSRSPVSISPPPNDSIGVPEPITQFVVARGEAAMPSNPFTSEYLTKLLEIQARERRAEPPPEPVAQAIEPPPPVQEAAPVLVAPVEAPPAPKRIVFHGVVHRPDRVRVALLEDRDAGLTRYLTAGESLYAHRVETIEFGRIVLLNPRQERVVLSIGQETQLEVQPDE